MDPPLLHIFSWRIIHISSAYPRGRPLDKPGKYVGNTRGSIALCPYGVGKIQNNISTSKERGGIVDSRYFIINSLFVSKMWILCCNH